MRFCSLESDRQKIRYGNCEKQKCRSPAALVQPGQLDARDSRVGRKKEIAKFEIKFPQLAVSKM
jgi:hypothetical protein